MPLSDAYIKVKFASSLSATDLITPSLITLDGKSQRERTHKHRRTRRHSHTRISEVVIKVVVMTEL